MSSAPSGDAPIRVAGLSGSLRSGSFNTALLRAAAELAPAGMVIEFSEIADIPPYNDDVRLEGFPDPVARLRAEPGAAGNPRGKVYNSVFVISDAGEIEEASDKTHLVPFGEYLPFQDLLEAIGLEQLTRVQGGFEPGSQRRVLQAASSRPFLPLICYEVVFSGAIRDNPTAQSAASWIVNLTNDAWFGHTPGPYQHLRQTRVRAVEEGLPIVRAANTGISAIIDPMGRLVAKLPVGMRGTADGRLPAAISTTFFIRFGTWIFATLLAISLAGSLLFRGRRSN